MRFGNPTRVISWSGTGPRQKLSARSQPEPVTRCSMRPRAGRRWATRRRHVSATTTVSGAHGAGRKNSSSTVGRTWRRYWWRLLAADSWIYLLRRRLDVVSDPGPHQFRWGLLGEVGLKHEVDRNGRMGALSIRTSKLALPPPSMSGRTCGAIAGAQNWRIDYTNGRYYVQGTPVAPSTRYGSTDGRLRLSWHASSITAAHDPPAYYLESSATHAANRRPSTPANPSAGQVRPKELARLIEDMRVVDVEGHPIRTSRRRKINRVSCWSVGDLRAQRENLF